MKNNSIIYEPDFIILNNELLTSLCIYFDELILVSNDSLENELSKIQDKKVDHFKEKSNYINNILKPLIKEEVITLYNKEEISNICLKSNEIELGNIDLSMKDDGLIINFKSFSDNRISRALVERCFDSKLKVSDLVRFLNVYILSTEYNIPIATNHNKHIEIKLMEPNNLSNSLALNTLCNLALPQLGATNPEDIIRIRKDLKDELIEFKAGILDITYLLYQNIKTTSKTALDIKNEMNMLINTKVKSSIMTLEHKIYTNKKKSFSNIVLNGTKFMLSGAMMTLGLGNKVNTLNNGLDVLQSLSDLSASYDKPEDRIASYIVQVNKRIT